MTEMDLYRSLGREAAKRRVELGLTQAEVAADIGLTRASLANIETGRQKVMLHHVYKLVSALRLASILDLLPPSFAFEDAEPLPLSRTDVTVRQKKQVENVIRLALAKTRPSGGR
jgi:transcriptional regulator with XRE-family HTH domain